MLNFVTEESVRPLNNKGKLGWVIQPFMPEAQEKN